MKISLETGSGDKKVFDDFAALNEEIKKSAGMNTPTRKSTSDIAVEIIAAILTFVIVLGIITGSWFCVQLTVILLVIGFLRFLFRF